MPASAKAEIERSIARSYIVPGIPPGTDATNDYWRARADQLDRAAIAQGLNDDAEFVAWFDAEIKFETVLSQHRRLLFAFARSAFRQGLALGREGRA